MRGSARLRRVRCTALPCLFSEELQGLLAYAHEKKLTIDDAKELVRARLPVP